jgi:hypothetical protein
VVGDGNGNTSTRIGVRSSSARPAPVAALLLGVLALLGAVSCSGDDPALRAEVVDRLTDAYPEASLDQAGCVADRLADRYGLDTVTDLLGTGDDDFNEDEYRDLFACGVVGDLRETLAQEIDNVGVGQAERECVSDSFLEALDDDDLDSLLEGQLSSDVFDHFSAALSNCGVMRLS